MKHCAQCGIETTNPKFCSKRCSAISTNKSSPKRKLTRKCAKCNTIVKSYRHRLCETHWNSYLESKSENLKNSTLLSYWTKKSLSDLHSSSKNVHIRLFARQWFKELTKKPCAICGYSKHVELCHIKPISSFKETDTIGDVNHPNNIIQLCRNCHWEFDHNLLKINLSATQDSNLDSFG